MKHLKRFKQFEDACATAGVGGMGSVASAGVSSVPGIAGSSGSGDVSFPLLKGKRNKTPKRGNARQVSDARFLTNDKIGGVFSVNHIKESHYEDLTPYEYGRKGQNKVNIGWLDTKADFPKGDVSPELIEKIKSAQTTERYKGWHDCPFCDKSKGRVAHCSTNQEVSSNGKTYVFPELLAHYIEKHHYLPPQEFLDAVEKVEIKKETPVTRPGFRSSRFK